MKHLAIIPDGNRRWARAHHLPTLEGHRRGYENVKTIGLCVFEHGVEFFSVFAFSTENWNRSREEVDYLMDLLFLMLTKELDFFLERDVRLKVLGSRERLSQKMVEAIQKAEEDTHAGQRGQLNVCINYGGRAEIVDGVCTLLKRGCKPEEITQEKFTESLWTSGIPDPDMIVRTSGEQRLSGFLTWSSVYSELKFVPKHWPDFTVEDLEECLTDFAVRQRRFGT